MQGNQEFSTTVSIIGVLTLCSVIDSNILREGWYLVLKMTHAHHRCSHYVLTSVGVEPVTSEITCSMQFLGKKYNNHSRGKNSASFHSFVIHPLSDANVAMINPYNYTALSF